MASAAKRCCRVLSGEGEPGYVSSQKEMFLPQTISKKHFYSLSAQGTYIFQLMPVVQCSVYIIVYFTQNYYQHRIKVDV